MLYEKCLNMIKEETFINLKDLDILRQSMALIDVKCLNLSLLEVEKVWMSYCGFHGKDIPIDKDYVKRFLKWITGVDYGSITNLYKCVDDIFTDSKVTN